MQKTKTKKPLKKDSSKAKPKSKGCLIEKNKVGREKVWEYSQALAERICYLIKTNPLPLETICKQNSDIPKTTIIYDWLGVHDGFTDMYLKAKQQQVLTYVEDATRIALNDSGDLIETSNGISGNSVNVARAKLQIDLVKWMAGRFMPRLFGDKIVQETTVTIKHEDALEALAKLPKSKE